MYTVEIFTSKEVWEIQAVSERRDHAIRVWEDCMMDGYDTRITFVTEKGNTAARSAFLV